ncbi:serine/threonine protein kinase [Dictyobacter aurantiacus]|uniref:Protein kinase domain-containing protein n=1 Tax=Dictyobacter aurantiacus TaxID=1936993 RepID=A0A401ZQ40_9CHLR|nr:serine/threonine-protein kinase [Dictyobacter aurantiacus]GCE08894.1 hypothetical protein KDAU_62230 [Dictyobacter aurantiacus]
MNECRYTYQYINHYHIQQLLGKSDLSEVYLAENMNNQTRVALKLLYGDWKGESAEKFLTRTATLTHLNHPNIVPILDFGVEDNVAFIAMRYIPDGNLRQRHPRGTRIDLATVISYIQQISVAIQYIHDLGFVHRDIKPHNLLVDKNAGIMLSDFGTTIVSHSLSPIHASLREFEGTAPYAAPEQLQGKPCRNSDQYALGIMIYEWLSGDWPFNGSFYEITHQHLFVEPPAFKERGLNCPPNVEQVIFRSLEKEPARRFPSVKRFAEELDWSTRVAQARGLTFGPITTTTTTAPPQIVQSKRQFRSPFKFGPE